MAVTAMANATGHLTIGHAIAKTAPRFSQSAACFAAVGPTIARVKDSTMKRARETVSAIAVARTRHQDRPSEMWWAWFSVPMSAAIPDDMLQIAPTRLSASRRPWGLS